MDAFDFLPGVFQDVLLQNVFPNQLIIILEEKYRVHP